MRVTIQHTVGNDCFPTIIIGNVGSIRQTKKGGHHLKITNWEHEDGVWTKKIKIFKKANIQKFEVSF